MEHGKKRAAEEQVIGPNPSKLRKLNYEDLLLENLPTAETYELSYMHRDTVSHVLSSNKEEVIVTCSVDGHIKFWKKVFHLIQFIKNFKVHNGLITGVSFSKTHALLCSVGIDRTLKIFDVPTCDLRTILKLSFAPSCCEFLPQRTYDWEMVAVAEEKAGKIHIVDPEGNDRHQAPIDDGQESIHQVKEEHEKDESVVIVETLTFHKHPIKAIKMNWALGVCFSIDQRAFLQVWDALTYDFPTSLPYKRKIDTQFLSLLQANSPPLSLSLSPQGNYLGVLLKDRIIRVFDCRTGKNICTINESLKQVIHTQQNPSAEYHSECVFGEQEYDKKLALQKDIEIAKQYLQNSNIEFDEGEQYVIYPSFHGIKVYNLKTRRLQRILGKKENERFIRVTVYQGKSMRNPSGSSNLQGERRANDPTFFCTAFKRPRFYIFSRRVTEFNSEGGLLRDIINERPPKQEMQLVVQPKASETRNEVVLQTTFGDIHILLYMEECPKTCENFIKLTRKGYYDGMIFHRIVRGFMNQTGCPNGDGTGGESIWGGTFNDELVPQKLRFDKPYLVAMANRGANTNGSQFFLTVVACPWLDNKHTLFGRVVKGIQTVCDINKLKTDKLDKPLMTVKIMNAKIIGDKL